MYVDESGNVLFLQKGDGANTIQFAKKARHSALYRSPWKNAADSLKNGNLVVLVQPEAFPNHADQGGWTNNRGGGGEWGGVGGGRGDRAGGD